MAVIVVRCPKTRKEVLPGIEIAEADFRSIQPAPSPVKCPICGEEHSWLPFAAGAAAALSARNGKARSVDQQSDETSSLSRPKTGGSDADN